MEQRGDVVRPVTGKQASVVLPVIQHPAHGTSLIVSERSRINGHNGRPMSNAGEVVLFGGSVEPGESSEQAALRELAEESGTSHLQGRDDFRIVTGLGSWITESGFLASGFLARVPSAFAADARPDAREVARIAYLPVSAVYAAPITREFHPVQVGDHTLGDAGEVHVESPTLRVEAANHGEQWVLWGLAGFMTSRLRELYPSARDLVAVAGA